MFGRAFFQQAPVGQIFFATGFIEGGDPRDAGTAGAVERIHLV